VVIYFISVALYVFSVALCVTKKIKELSQSFTEYHRGTQRKSKQRENEPGLITTGLFEYYIPARFPEVREIGDDGVFIE
jgi:hypothetical protein